MGVYHSYLTHSQFLERIEESFLDSKNQKTIREKVDKIPEKIVKNDSEYVFSIDWCFMSISGGFYNFIIHYYCKERGQAIIKTSVYSGIEEVLDDTIEQLKRLNFIE